MPRSKYPIRVASNRDEDPRLLQGLEAILKYRRGYVVRQPVNEDVILLASGGLDSMVTIQLIIEDWNVRVYPLFVRRNARAGKYEEEAFLFFMEYFKDKYPKNLMDYRIVEADIPVSEFKHYKAKDRLERLGHPMRNATLQNIAVQYRSFLESNKGIVANTIFTSTVADDKFPHSCLLALRVENILACADGGDWDIQITSPLIDVCLREKVLYKRDLIKYAISRSIPLEKTRTCIEAANPADGTCAECVCRLRAFSEAGVGDPLEYAKEAL